MIHKKVDNMTGRSQRHRRRHPFASVILIAVGLAFTGAGYAAFSSTATAESAPSSSQKEEGSKLFAANCATCHGANMEGTQAGPSLIGVGASSVDFQVGTGRMPLAMQGPQGMRKPPQFTKEQTEALAAYVASLSPGPGIPTEEEVKAEGDARNGSELFRINCAMCHNVAGAGGALTEGKFAPALTGVENKYIYEAMTTGPQNMPVFNDHNITPEEKRDIITYLKYLQDNPSPGGYELGSLGPVAEGLFLWIFGIGAVVGLTVWLTAKSN